MTDYVRIEINSPEEVFDELKERFYVEEDNGDSIVIIYEESDPLPFNNPVRDVVEENGLIEEYVASGQGIHTQEDLPEDLRDEDTYKEEQKAVVPAEENWSDEEVRKVLTVLHAIEESESDHDHVRMLSSAQDRLRELYGRDLEPLNDDVTPEMVRIALDLLKKEGVERRGGDYDHPNNGLIYAVEFVEMETTYTNGVLPST